MMRISRAAAAVVLFGLLTGEGIGQERRDTTGAGATNQQLRQKLLELETVDQHVRDKLISVSSAAKPDMEAFRLVVREMDSVDAYDTGALKAIIDRHGWPGTRLVGTDGENAAFLIVQHADRDTAFQSSALVLVQKAFAAGEVPGQSYALLTDRVRVHRGQPQLYGSQFKILDGKLTVDPIEDEAHVNERRESLGLPPMSEYVKTVREVFHLDGK